MVLQLMGACPSARISSSSVCTAALQISSFGWEMVVSWILGKEAKETSSKPIRET